MAHLVSPNTNAPWFYYTTGGANHPSFPPLMTHGVVFRPSTMHFPLVPHHYCNSSQFNTLSRRPPMTCHRFPVAFTPPPQPPQPSLPPPPPPPPPPTSCLSSAKPPEMVRVNRATADMISPPRESPAEVCRCSQDGLNTSLQTFPKVKENLWWKSRSKTIWKDNPDMFDRALFHIHSQATVYDAILRSKNARMPSEETIKKAVRYMEENSFWRSNPFSLVNGEAKAFTRIVSSSQNSSQVTETSSPGDLNDPIPTTAEEFIPFTSIIKDKSILQEDSSSNSANAILKVVDCDQATDTQNVLVDSTNKDASPSSDQTEPRSPNCNDKLDHVEADKNHVSPSKQHKPRSMKRNKRIDKKKRCNSVTVSNAPSSLSSNNSRCCPSKLPPAASNIIRGKKQSKTKKSGTNLKTVVKSKIRRVKKESDPVIEPISSLVTKESLEATDKLATCNGANLYQSKFVCLYNAEESNIVLHRAREIISLEVSLAEKMQYFGTYDISTIPEQITFFHSPTLISELLHRTNECTSSSVVTGSSTCDTGSRSPIQNGNPNKSYAEVVRIKHHSSCTPSSLSTHSVVEKCASCKLLTKQLPLSTGDSMTNSKTRTWAQMCRFESSLISSARLCN